MKKTILQVVACTALSLVLNANANELANPFGKVKPAANSVQTSESALAKTGSKSATSTMSITSGKRVDDYLAYPVGSDQRKLAMLSAIYAARLSRHPDYSGLTYWMTQLQADLSNAADVLWTIDNLSGGALFNPNISGGPSQNIQYISAMISAYSGQHFSYGQADSLYYDTRGAAVAVLEWVSGLSYPTGSPLAQNKVSLGLILGWEEQNNTVTTAPMQSITSDYQSVINAAAAY